MPTCQLQFPINAHCRLHIAYAYFPYTHTYTVPSELSPDSYLSSDGGSFQLTKTAAGEGPGPKEEKKRKERKYRVPEDILEGEREKFNWQFTIYKS